MKTQEIAQAARQRALTMIREGAARRDVTRNFTDEPKWAELRHLPMSLGFVGAWSTGSA